MQLQQHQIKIKVLDTDRECTNEFRRIQRIVYKADPCYTNKSNQQFALSLIGSLTSGSQTFFRPSKILREDVLGNCRLFG